MQTKNSPGARRWERERVDVPVGLVLKAENFRSDPSATMIDLSLSGAGVKTALALVPGEWVGIVPKGEFPHAIPARVAWVREDPSNGWTIAGLSFLQSMEV
jgi:hypothetical protein